MHQAQRPRSPGGFKHFGAIPFPLAFSKHIIIVTVFIVIAAAAFSVTITVTVPIPIFIVAVISTVASSVTVSTVTAFVLILCLQLLAYTVACAEGIRTSSFTDLLGPIS